MANAQSSRQLLWENRRQQIIKYRLIVWWALRKGGAGALQGAMSPQQVLEYLKEHFPELVCAELIPSTTPKKGSH